MGLSRHQQILGFWKPIFFVVYPIVLLPIFIAGQSLQYRSIYIVLVLIGYHLTHVVPYSIVGMMPLAMFPILEISTNHEISVPYFSEAIGLFIGGNIVSLALKETKLSSRIGLKLILISKCDLRMLHLIITSLCMLSAMLLMDIIAVIVWCTILQDLLDYLDKRGICSCFKTKSGPTDHLSHAEYQNTLKENIIEHSKYDISVNMELSPSTSIFLEDSENNITKEQPQPTNITKCFYLIVLFASELGGISLHRSNLSNFYCKEFFDTYGKAQSQITFYKWPIYAFPYALICMALVWIYLQYSLLGLFRPKINISTEINFTPEVKLLIRKVVLSSLEEMGRLSFKETLVLSCISIYISTFFCVNLITAKPMVYIYSLLFWLVVAIFALPSNTNFLNMFNECASKRPKKESPPILPWQVVQRNTYWSVIFVIGGSGAMVKALSNIPLQDYFIYLSGSSPYLTTLMLCLYVTLATQFVENSQISTMIVMSVLKKSAEENVNPLLHMIPATICCSFGSCFYISSILVSILGYSSDIPLKSMLGHTCICVLICFMVLMLTSHIGLKIIYSTSFPK